MRKQQKGFSLIEVLVATVIMAIGILGIAGLQVISLQQNRSSLMRSEALQLGNDIIDRMRANSAETYAPVEYSDAPPAAAKNCTANLCTAAEMADYDIALWKCMVNKTDAGGDTYSICTTLSATLGKSASLPDGEAEIQVASGVQTVRIRWVDDGSGTKATVTLSTRTDE